ncbi:MAG TPA: hypothetical protein VIV60_20165 [Polyangiaceae bacterium]
MFALAETRMRLADPMKHAPHREEIRQERPHFEPDFWGPRGIDAIHEQAGGWPHLVQLLAEALLDRVNIRGAARVDDEIYNESIVKALVRGHNVFSQLLTVSARATPSVSTLPSSSTVTFRRRPQMPPSRARCAVGC